MNIPVMNLKDGLVDIKEEIYKKIEYLIENTRFIGGDEVEDFEKEFAEFCQTKYAVGCSNGTDALILALKTLNVQPEDTVLVPANTFIATSEAVTAIGANVEFVDIEGDYFTIDPVKIEEKLKSSEKKISAIIVVHLYGQMANMPVISELAHKYGVKVIEDSSQAHGSQLQGYLPGKWGDLATYSFYPGKNLGAFGDAGAVTTNNEEYYMHIKMIVNHGRWKEKYTHSIEGFNKRIDTIQAAILRIKLTKLNYWNELRENKASIYMDKLIDKQLTLPKIREGASPVWHIFAIKIQNRDDIKEYLKKKGVSTGIHYPIPLHLQPAYKYKGYKLGDFPVSERCALEQLSLPFWPEISEEEIDYVANLLE